MKNQFLKRIVLIVFICSALFGIGIVLVLKGSIQLNNPDKIKYPVRGIDVSSWQGVIDWKTLSQNDIGFVFIKATEGSTFVDKQFAHNWKEARDNDLSVGAYHFFSYDSSGDAQADNFIATVPLEIDTLPPVIDIEFYGDNEKNPPNREDVSWQLQKLMDRLEKHYEKKPILYATMKSYTLYIEGDYFDYPIWIRNVIREPRLPDNRTWTFWQFTDRAKLEGYSGKEEFIDLNLFYGSEKEWDSFKKQNL